MTRKGNLLPRPRYRALHIRGSQGQQQQQNQLVWRSSLRGRDEFEKAQKSFGASAISVLDDHPGGGEQVTLEDPMGHPVHLIFGWQEKKPQPTNLEKLTVNYKDDKSRKGRFQRFQRGTPVPVHRWGHYGVTYL